MVLHKPWLKATHARPPGLAVHLGAQVGAWSVVAEAELGWELGAILCQTRDLQSFRWVVSSSQVALPCSMCCSHTAW